MASSLNLLLCPLAFVIFSQHLVQRAPVLETNIGRIEGIDFKTHNVTAFLGIPYAKKPLRERRFKAPDALDPATNTSLHTATKPASRCHSSNVPQPDVSEDCLYLNLFVAENSTRASLLVIFTNQAFHRSVLVGIASNGVAVAVVHFREGLFGFLTTDESQGNYGIDDIRLSLEWLTVNARSIGVSNNFILLAEGNAASVVHWAVNDYPQDPPVSAILLNGNIYSKRFTRNLRATFNARRLIKEVACDLPSSVQSMDCLRTKDADVLLASVENMHLPEEYGEPFGVVGNSSVVEAKHQFPLLLGVQLVEDPAGSTTGGYNWTEFKTFLARLIHDRDYRNAPLLRRLALHEYVHSRGDKKNAHFLYRVSREMLRDRDFYTPLRRLANEWTQPMWITTYNESEPLKRCLRADSNDEMCREFWALVNDFVNNREAPVSSRNLDSFNVLHWNTTKSESLILFRRQNAFWNELLPIFDQLELTGRRYEFLNDDVSIPDPLEEEDDEQQWHTSVNPGLTSEQIVAEVDRNLREDL